MRALSTVDWGRTQEQRLPVHTLLSTPTTGTTVPVSSLKTILQFPTLFSYSLNEQHWCLCLSGQAFDYSPQTNIGNILSR
jgi:hypothetical protein